MLLALLLIHFNQFIFNNMDNKAASRLLSVGLLFLLSLALTGSIAFLGSEVSSLTSTSSQQSLEIIEKKNKVTITLTKNITADQIYVIADTNSYASGGINNTSINSVMGPRNGNQYLYSDGAGGVGTVFIVNKTEQTEHISVKKVTATTEQTIQTYTISS
jgi:hypothetical protein